MYLRTCLFMLFVCLKSFSSTAQIHEYERVFTDSIDYKDFHQGYLDSQDYYNGTRDFFNGTTKGLIHVLMKNSGAKRPNINRLYNSMNPNNGFLNTNSNYSNGYQHGAYIKKKRRMSQGTITLWSAFAGFVIYDQTHGF